MLVPRPRAVDADGDAVEDLGTLSEVSMSGDVVAGVPNVARAELGGAGEEGVAPGAVLGAEAELLERVGEERPGVGVGVVGEHEVLADLGAPAVVAVVPGLAGHGERAVAAAHGLDVTGGRGLSGGWGQRLAGLASYQPM